MRRLAAALCLVPGVASACALPASVVLTLPRLAHLPLGALMVGYAVLGLWLLSSPTGA